MAPKKSKKDANSINSRLALVMKSGKVTMGYKSTLKSLRTVRFDPAMHSTMRWFACKKSNFRLLTRLLYRARPS